MKQLTDEAKGRLAYAWLWIWFTIVACLSGWVYLKLLDLATPTAWGLPIVAELLRMVEGTILSLLLKIIAGTLFCWRTLKVIVLHGSPFPFGLNLTTGRENNGSSGRPVHLSLIERGKKHWFGAILRAHPSSDKLVRSRLEFMIFSLPCKRALMVQESRLKVVSGSDCTKIGVYFFQQAGKYLKKSEFKSPESFRRDVARHLDAIAGQYRSGIKRIDGLNWQQFADGKWRILDDFGFEIGCEHLGAERYKLTGLGLNGDAESMVDSIKDLRKLAKRDLHPT